MTATLEAVDERTAIEAALAQFRDLGGDDFAREMVELLRDQTPSQFAEIDSALACGDMVGAQRHAHSMKSSFGNFGATTCQRIAVEMDLAGKMADAAAYRSAYTRLQLAFQELLTYLG